MTARPADPQPVEDVPGPAGPRRRRPRDRARRDPRPRRPERLRQVDDRQDPRRLPRARPRRRRRGRRRAVRARLGRRRARRRAALRAPGPRPRRGDDRVRQLPDEPAAARPAPAAPRRRSRPTPRRAGPPSATTSTRRAPIAELAESERTAVGVARALDGAGEDGRFPLLVLDEATAALPGPGGRPPVRRAAPRSRPRGTAVLFISHYLDEVLAIADRVTVLRDGRRVATEATGDAHPRGPANLMLGRELVAEAAAHTRDRAAGRRRRRRCCRLRGVGGAELAPLDLDVQPGEVVGIAGLTGSGRDELASLLSGRRLRAGDRASSTGGRSRRSTARGDRRRPVRRARRPRQRRPVPDGHRAREPDDRRPARRSGRAGGCARRPRAPRPRPGSRSSTSARRTSEAIIGELSGGNQQKVVMARWFRCRPRVLVLDEPTQGVDVGSKADIHRLVDLASTRGHGHRRVLVGQRRARAPVLAGDRAATRRRDRRAPRRRDHQRTDRGDPAVARSAQPTSMADRRRRGHRTRSIVVTTHRRRAPRPIARRRRTCSPASARRACSTCWR